MTTQKEQDAQEERQRHFRRSNPTPLENLLEREDRDRLRVLVAKMPPEDLDLLLSVGTNIAGRTVTVVEDVITTGGQVVISTNDLRALGARVGHVVCVIDRSTDQGAALAAEGLTMHALLTRAQLDAAEARRG